MTLARLIIIVSAAFWGLIAYYAVLSVAGLFYRTSSRKVRTGFLEQYPSVDILIPAYNEGKVLFETLDAMARLVYPGELNVYLLDDNSSDQTEAIGNYFAELYRNFHYVKVPKGQPKGKARVLNYGLKVSSGELVAVYDADNQPNPWALIRLVHKLLEDERYGGVVGYVRTKNMYKNALTRMIGLEFMLFQLVMQCGRWQLFKIGTLTGTNFVVKRSLLRELGGWNNSALAEDAELTARIYAKGYVIPVVDDSETYEQEPESFGAFLRQRTRWLIGNLQLISKILRERELRRGRNLLTSIQLVSVYYLFVLLLIASDIWFVMGILGRLTIPYTIPLLLLWFETVWIYASQIIAAEVVDKEVNLGNIIIAILMYFTYAQLWLFLTLRSYVLRASKVGRKVEWDKTPRF
ncbi:glycosyltransferase family 2 protein [Coprothermobacteraceae bacterium]|nr:glycosyltransferase family 2 protein [Coprothermobacteraceae bacterium]